MCVHVYVCIPLLKKQDNDEKQRRELATQQKRAAIEAAVAIAMVEREVGR